MSDLGMTMIQVQVAMDPWHLAPSWHGMALCGAFPKRPARGWAAHAPLSIVIDEDHRCTICQDAAPAGVWGASHG